MGNMLHLYATCDLQRGHCHHRNTQRIQSCAAGGIACSVAGAQMLKIAVVFHGQLRFGPIEVATVKPLVSHGLRPSTHINTAVQLRQREPIAAQAVGKAQQHGQHRFSRRRRSVSSIAQRTQRLFPPPHTFGLTHVRFEFRDRGQRGAFSHVARGNVVRSAQSRTRSNESATCRKVSSGEQTQKPFRESSIAFLLKILVCERFWQEHLKRYEKNTRSQNP